MFVIVQNICMSDQATISRYRHYAVVFFSILPTYLQQYLHKPPDPLKHCILFIDLHAVKILISLGEMSSLIYFQGGFFGVKIIQVTFERIVFVTFVTD